MPSKQITPKLIKYLNYSIIPSEVSYQEVVRYVIDNFEILSRFVLLSLLLFRTANNLKMTFQSYVQGSSSTIAVIDKDENYVSMVMYVTLKNFISY